jgi:hypothetical protein
VGKREEAVGTREGGMGRREGGTGSATEAWPREGDVGRATESSARQWEGEATEYAQTAAARRTATERRTRPTALGASVAGSDAHALVQLGLPIT